MKELFSVALYFVEGKSMYPLMRRLLNFLFNISIASFIYEKSYGYYTWLNYNDYKDILDFFVKGQFFIPLSIYLIVYGITQFISEGFFIILNHIKSVKLQRQILTYQLRSNSIDRKLHELKPLAKIVSPVDITPDRLLEFCLEFKKTMKPEVFQQIENELKEPRQNFQANFVLAFRTLIAISVFKFNLPQFSWLLYLTTIIILFILMYVQMLAYRLLDILPTILRKFHIQAEQYLKDHNNIELTA